MTNWVNKIAAFTKKKNSVEEGDKGGKNTPIKGAYEKGDKWHWRTFNPGRDTPSSCGSTAFTARLPQAILEKQARNEKEWQTPLAARELMRAQNLAASGGFLAFSEAVNEGRSLVLTASLLAGIDIVADVPEADRVNGHPVIATSATDATLQAIEILDATDGDGAVVEKIQEHVTTETEAPANVPVTLAADIAPPPSEPEAAPPPVVTDPNAPQTDSYARIYTLLRNSGFAGPSDVMNAMNDRREIAARNGGFNVTVKEVEKPCPIRNWRSGKTNSTSAFFISAFWRLSTRGVNRVRWVRWKRKNSMESPEFFRKEIISTSGASGPASIFMNKFCARLRCLKTGIFKRPISC